MESGLHGLESEADVRFEGLRAYSKQVYHRFSLVPEPVEGVLQWVGQSKNRFD